MVLVVIELHFFCPIGLALLWFRALNLHVSLHLQFFVDFPAVYRFFGVSQFSVGDFRCIYLHSSFHFPFWDLPSVLGQWKCMHLSAGGGFIVAYISFALSIGLAEKWNLFGTSPWHLWRWGPLVSSVYMCVNHESRDQRVMLWWEQEIRSMVVWFIVKTFSMEFTSCRSVRFNGVSAFVSAVGIVVYHCVVSWYE